MDLDGKPNLRSRARSFITRALTTREVMLRVDGRLRYVRLGRFAQIGLLGVVALAFVGFGVIAWEARALFQERDDLAVALRAAQADQLALMQDVAAYDEILSGAQAARGDVPEDAAQRRRAALARDALRRRMDDLAETVDEDAFATALTTLRGQMEADSAEQADLAAGRAALQDEVALLRAELSEARLTAATAQGDLDDAQAALVAARVENADAAAALAAMTTRADAADADLTAMTTARATADATAAGLAETLDDRETALAAAETALADRTNSLDQITGALAQAEDRVLRLEAALAETESAVGAAVAQRRAAEAARDDARSRADGAEARLAELETAQIALFAEFADSARRNAAPMEKAIALAGVNARKIVSNALGRRRAQGGPYFASAATLGLSDGFETAATDAADAISRWEALRDVLRILPLDAPMDQYRVTSDFGRRIDPVNGRPAMHYGLDIAHAMKAPIRATSPGKVVFAGWKGNYGRFVEIDHGAGVRTRYGHLHKILVRRGQKVKFRDKIGLLGNSGRSTGPHLHYEVTVDGRPLDPQKFIAAGRHVLKEW